MNRSFITVLEHLLLLQYDQGEKRYPNIRIVLRFLGFDLYHERMPESRQPMKCQMEAETDRLIFLGNLQKILSGADSKRNNAGNKAACLSSGYGSTGKAGCGMAAS